MNFNKGNKGNKRNKGNKGNKAVATLTLALTLALCLLLTPARAEASVYITAAGDTLSQIAALTGCETSLLSAINGYDAEEELPSGLLLTLSDGPALTHRVQEGDSLWSLARAYGCEASQLAALNDLQPPYLIFPGQSLLLPLGEEQTCLPTLSAADGAPTDSLVAATAYLTATVSPTGALSWPVDGVITSAFGWRQRNWHSGLDIACPSGTPVLAAAAGQVTEAGWKSAGYGYAVMIDHGNGVVTLYGHCSQVQVTPGQWVEAGQSVALSGSTGNSTGPHLHLEVRIDGQCRDPLDYLEQRL